MKSKNVTLVVVLIAVLVVAAVVFMQKPKSNQPPTADYSKNPVFSYSLSGTVTKIDKSVITMDTFKITKVGETAKVETDTKQITLTSDTKVFTLADGIETADDVSNVKVGSKIVIYSDQALTVTPITASKVDITK